jgi:hypothetical protein
MGESEGAAPIGGCRRYFSGDGDAARVAPGEPLRAIPIFCDPGGLSPAGEATEVGLVAEPGGDEALWRIGTPEGPLPGRYVLRGGEFLPIGLAPPRRDSPAPPDP